METIELGAGHNPTPLERHIQEKNIKIYITIETTDEFPKEWDRDDIKLYIKENINEYINTSDINVEEIEV
jgi:hypothetical protein